jgi:hypothetical protein
MLYCCRYFSSGVFLKDSSMMISANINNSIERKNPVGQQFFRDPHDSVVNLYHMSSMQPSYLGCDGLELRVLRVMGVKPLVDDRVGTLHWEGKGLEARR